MVLNRTKLPWMRDDRVILSLTIGAHNGDDIIEAWTHGTWTRKHTRKCRIATRHSVQKFSESQWDLFVGFENTYNLKVRQAPSFIPITEEKANWLILPKMKFDDFLSGSTVKQDFLQGSIPDSLYKIHNLDRNAFNIQRSKNLLRQILDLAGFSCFRYRYNYSSKKIEESMELAQFFIIDAVPVHTHTEDMHARIAGKALITAMMKYMAGVSRTAEIEVFIMVGRGTKVRLYRIVFEPEYLGDISKGLEPEEDAILWEDKSGETDLLRLKDRTELLQKIEHIRKAMHVRI